MRMGEFWEAIDAYWEEKAADRRHIGELVRGAALRLFNIQLKRKDQITNPAKFWRMPWDEDQVAAEAEEIKRLNALSDEERQEEINKFYQRIGLQREDGTESESES